LNLKILVIMFITNWACNRETKSFLCIGNTHGQNKEIHSSQFWAQIVRTNRLNLQRWRSNRPLRSMNLIHSKFQKCTRFNHRVTRTSLHNFGVETFDLIFVENSRMLKHSSSSLSKLLSAEISESRSTHLCWNVAFTCGDTWHPSSVDMWHSFQAIWVTLSTHFWVMRVTLYMQERQR
jgi:hypothetical protein